VRRSGSVHLDLRWGAISEKPVLRWGDSAGGRWITSAAAAVVIIVFVVAVIIVIVVIVVVITP
jgi:hypothetical protein